MTRILNRANMRPDREFCCWPDCERPPEVDPIPLCERHYIHIGRLFLNDYRDKLHILAQEQAAADPERSQEILERRERHEQERASRSQVYYMRIGDYIKIGYSIDVRQRLRDFRLDPDALLATEPGARRLERHRHQQFAPERVGRRENFKPSPRLLAHIEALKTRRDGEVPA